MTLLKDNDYKEINVALLSLEADIKNKITNFDTSAIDKQLAEINSRIDKINAGGGSSSDEIDDINSKLNSNSNRIKNIERNIEGIDTQINDIEQKLADIFSAKNRIADLNTATAPGIYYWSNEAANKPINYGVLLVNKLDRGSISLWINQVAYGTNNKIYFRQNINSDGWTKWKAIAFDGEPTAVDAGVQTVENGGTGVTTQLDINKAFIGNLAEGYSDVTDGTMFVSSYASDNGFSETNEGALNKPYKRKFSAVWNYIKGKISSVLGLTKYNYGGKSATAGTADKTLDVIDYGDTSRTVRIGYEGQGLTADNLLHLAGYTRDNSGLVKIKDVDDDELIKWLGIPRIKYADYKTPIQTFTQFEQVPVELSKFSSEVTPNNVLCFMVIYCSGVQLIASADYETATSSLKCALIALKAGTGCATIRCVYMV